jgi:acyl transferase domain-containing protein/NAD(P)H-dependent flavin oxidoreductase YrpB (nitropropane dioxygenase family)
MTSHDARPGDAPVTPRTQDAPLSATRRPGGQDRPEPVIGLSPFGRPDAALVAALARAGALGVLDLGGPAGRVRAELARLSTWGSGPFGVRVTRDCDLLPEDLEPFAGRIGALVLGADLADDPGTRWGTAGLAASHRILAEVTTAPAAREAVRHGAAGVIAVGNEAAGRVGELSSFVLLQRLLAADLAVPVWVRGGIGTRTAAAAAAGGAAGVVLDTQLSLLAEADVAAEIAQSRRNLDGETAVVAGYRVQVPSAVRLSAEDLDAMTGEDVLARLRDPRHGSAFAPLGQDGFAAAEIADRFATVARTVRAFEKAMADVFEPPARPGAAADAALTVLAGDSPLCAALGLRRPVVQGPMTRVSDLPEFALAVADDGALPCLALAMADGAATTRLLHRTRDLLGDRPWGVGILGFAAEDVLTAQLEVIQEVKPSAVVIAGGRPEQAAALEAVGIPAFLHVPSRTLLRLYLDAGARRFVFEGAECGGHVGPRSSFPLWEAQLGVLAEFLDEAGAEGDRTAGELQVIFAGGIHDARSAAMVAAAAATTAARGVAVGLLMGTAYLCTEEAVRTGAVLPLFQQQVLRASETALLQTAPGHLTRCVPSPFVTHFEQVKQALREAGTAGPQAWAELETLNVGRLRVASKGVERLGDELVTVDADRQVAEGLFMAGQVATLRGAATTIAALHEDVTTGAARFLDATRRRAPEAAPRRPLPGVPAPGPVDVAVIGMAAVLPKAVDVASYWANVLGGVDAVEAVPADRWDPEIFYDSELGITPSGRRSPSKWGGFLPRVPFDPLRYGIPPSVLPNVEPVQFLALEVARRAMEDAGLTPGGFDPSRTAVVFGTESNSDYHGAITLRGTLPAYYGEVPAELDEVLPQITADTFPGILGNIIASRISNRLDLGGPAYVVDAACGSSLAALDLACKELVLGTSDVVLCGGADLQNGSTDYLMFSSLGALSPSGRARTFDSSADGTTLAEGVVCVALKRLADATRDGDRIYAVVKAVGGASDGRSLGITAPRVEGQRLALERAYQRAGVSPSEVGLVEAHGTGTMVGDRTELTALTDVYSQAGARTGGTQLGSVKSQIGHSKTASGLAGLVKVALSIYHGVRPPTLNVRRPNPAWDAATSPFVFASDARPWPVPLRERVGAVSAFGFGGANFHAVLAGHGDDVPHRHALDAWPSELFLFRGADRAAAVSAVRSLQRLLEANDGAGRPWRLRDLARTAATRADGSTAPVRIAAVAEDLDDLAGLLRTAVADVPEPRRGLFLAGPAGPGAQGAGTVAVLFPGQGSQRPGMLAELFVTFPELQDYLRAGSEWADLIHPPSTFTPERAAAVRAALTDTRAAQPALGVAGLAAHHLLERLGIRAGMFGGHSFGELVALAAAGAYDSATLLRLATRRARAILDAAEAAGGDTGTMAAVRATAAQVHEVLAATGLTGEVVIANHNAPSQVVVSGTTNGVSRAVAALAAGGHRAVPLDVACAFHSPIVATAVDRFAEALADAPVAAPEVPVYANRSASPYPADPDSVRAELAAQVGSPVRFTDQVEAMYAAGARVFVEAGPGQVLVKLVGAVLGDRPHTAVALDRPPGGVRGLLETLAELAVAGAVPRLGWLFRGRDATDVTGAVPPRSPAWSVDGRAVVTADGRPLPGGLQPSRRVRRPEPEPAVSAGTDERRLLVAEFLRTSRDMLVHQRDVMLSYLGTAPPPAPAPALAPVPAPVPALAPAGAPVGGAAEPVAPAGGPVPVEDTVLEVICASTGYPAEMIDADLDLETDLSVDSIKRAEIAGILIRRLGSSSRLDGAVDDLVRLRTVRAITGLLTDRLGAEPDPATPPEATRPRDTSPAAPPRDTSPATAPVPGRAPRRYTVRYVPEALPEPGPPPPARWRVTILGDAGLLGAGALADRLRALGVEVAVVPDGDPGTVPAELDAVVYLGTRPADDAELDLPGDFELIRSVLSRAPRLLLGVLPLAAPPGQVRAAGHGARDVAERAAGLRGLFRCVAAEYPGLTARVVEVEAGGIDVADAVVTELAAAPTTGGPVVVRRTAQGRFAARTVPAPLGPLAGNGAGPAAGGAAEAAAVGLDRDAVVLLVGGARGIAAGFATMLAGAAGCRLELVGRTAPPSAAEDPRTAGATDERGLRQSVIGLGIHAPRQVERAVRRILAEREIRTTLADVARHGAAVRYHQADVTDAGALRKVVEQVTTDHGRLDGVVYAAGVIEDRLLAEKDPASFRRVFGTKVDGVRALFTTLDDLDVRPRFVTLFGSIAGVAGNRGQGDYAAANDALETLGGAWAARSGVRTLTVHWGPWAPSARHQGMVGPGLRQDFARRGIELVDQDEGHLALLRELAWGDRCLRAVIYSASDWSAPSGEGSVR